MPREIDIFIKRISLQAQNLEIPLRLVVNNREHQKTNTECGMYSLFMIIMMLKHPEMTPEEFIKDRIPDDLMFYMRGSFFSTP